jgi:hypothetical protein
MGIAHAGIRGVINGPNRDLDFWGSFGEDSVEYPLMSNGDSNPSCTTVVLLTVIEAKNVVDCGWRKLILSWLLRVVYSQCDLGKDVVSWDSRRGT